MAKVRLEDLDKKTWKKLKSDAGIKATPWFKKSDASVGSYVAKAIKARESYQATLLATDLLKYQDALGDLKKAFEDFIDSKGLTELGKSDKKYDKKSDLLKEIQDWINEINDEINSTKLALAKFGKVLGDDPEKFEKAEAKKKKEVWGKMGLFPDDLL